MVVIEDKLKIKIVEHNNEVSSLVDLMGEQDDRDSCAGSADHH